MSPTIQPTAESFWIGFAEHFVAATTKDKDWRDSWQGATKWGNWMRQQVLLPLFESMGFAPPATVWEPRARVIYILGQAAAVVMHDNNKNTWLTKWSELQTDGRALRVLISYEEDDPARLGKQLADAAVAVRGPRGDFPPGTPLLLILGPFRNPEGKEFVGRRWTDGRFTILGAVSFPEH